LIAHTAGHGFLRREVGRLNIVCLSGELARDERNVAISLPAGWTSLVLDVHREGDDDPGVVPVVLALPPTVISPNDLHALRPGRPILVIGRLQVDVDYTLEMPVAYHSVVVNRIEFMPREEGGLTSLAPRRVI
jgi:hypothetical protein